MVSIWSSASSLCCLSWVWSTREPKKNKLGTVRLSGTDSGTGSVSTNCAFLARLEMELNSGQSWFLPRRQENVEALDRPWSKQMVIWASALHIIEVCKQTFYWHPKHVDRLGGSGWGLEIKHVFLNKNTLFPVTEDGWIWSVVLVTWFEQMFFWANRLKLDILRLFKRSFHDILSCK